LPSKNQNTEPIVQRQHINRFLKEFKL